jgi:hypothetical protein
MEVTALAVHPRDDGIVYTATGYWLGTTDARAQGQSAVSTDRALTGLVGLAPLLASLSIGGWMAALTVGALAITIAIRSRTGCEGESASPCN